MFHLTAVKVFSLSPLQEGRKPELCVGQDGGSLGQLCSGVSALSQDLPPCAVL